MAATDLSAEIAEDYSSSLDTLTTNDRYAINNFTVIAKENTEHADAISTALVEHIRKTHPNYKLPALYVLDSIAKNIGTPYTLFLGHKLYGTFMNAYTLADPATRRRLEEMLKTWKTSVPGSLDSRPVFAPEITKKIENALLQAKTAALKTQQQIDSQNETLRRRNLALAGAGQWRGTPTPPQNGVPFHPSQIQPYSQQLPQNQFPPQYGHYSQPPQMTPQMPQYAVTYQSPLQSDPHPAQISPLPDIGQLHGDVEYLISAGKEEVASHLDDASKRTQLMALLQLQTVINSRQLSPMELHAVRSQVDDLQKQLADRRAAARVPSASQVSSLMMSTSPYINPTPITNTPLYALPAVSTPSIQPATLSQAISPPAPTPMLPSAASLASLLAAVGRVQPDTPMVQPVPLPSTSLTQTHIHAPTETGASDLLASLRAAGIISAIQPQLNGNNDIAPSSQAPLPVLSLSSLLQAHQTQSQTLETSFPAASKQRYDVQLTSVSLKIPRARLVMKLYQDRPNQCLSCGKRFMNDEKGRAQKSGHMDWHFRTNQRLNDTAKRGASRSWYVDELEWIRSREAEEGKGDESNKSGKDARTLAAEAALKNNPKNNFIRVPNDTTLSNQPCSICQEKFNTSWNDEIQDWVWLDAVQIGSRVYHASCHADLKKDRGSTPSRVDTPDSVLGKRKAEAGSNPSPAKSRRRSVD